MREMKMQIKGYASLFHAPDKTGDEILPGAFRKTLAQPTEGFVRMLYQHDVNRPIGKWMTIRETKKGLWVEGILATHSSEVKNVAALISAGAVDGLSIGYRVNQAIKGRGKIRRSIREIELVEISIVTFPMQLQARIQKTKDSVATATTHMHGAAKRLHKLSMTK